MANKRWRESGVRGLIAAAAAIFIVGGAILMAASAASQRQAPSAPVAGDSGPGSATDLDGSRRVSPATRSSGRAQSKARTLPRSVPVALDIPSIGVHSPMQRVGQAEDGTLEVPSPGPHYGEAAWYRHSPTPGSLGPAILVGHVDSAADGPSVFYRLTELRPGDRVSVTRADGSIAVFAVDEVHRYAKDNFPTDLVYGDIDHAGLRILTCGGAFDGTTGHYLDNVVVFASLEGPHSRTL